MSLTPEQVRQVAHLARLKLDEDEMERMRLQLSSILDHIEMLQAIDVTDVPITAQVTDLTNVTRIDAVTSSLPVDAALANAPDRQGDYFRVKAVFEE
ncbi:MAG TPA: Asp-tRNA(Asn)/Glu-tRNA(Gln) amidotransferase GatCAB subunit C [Herpetosiphon sp.]|uniref:Aspartyl/glutamyl-tRNA(Asn/Gln) amidotransferase subunit C n=1 Tax=Herpetosiphon aurantiacus (strain ATCC 23779 / DSM 785 / 114-95) TaxID=316274 RepID=GATC_HERA2|nr:Asp-tRNA(Asn)/Glu-tRNA(Gln) amidotransferase subunit GatC [Herpetosiphon sp.]A9B090.1 RecName: Full=Aspartyl/glutamyl-tRNA(Asn/Gln) amidotransferase subunit C; Short=Asp/Glu-ADT subunit C [Herpetosiphon aurantiacus DSM 785]ABX05199.1 glutamyl-tRNA(Gln) amidotransferase, C subunit [Herpetosiphon aurantiacus DSM 785]HBW51290.1 Asp-tRNA(Asn)/Glu-tRNA(Gln) amidotransferase GatCAB subunit C [Herpetosiphon sp.]